MILTAELNLPGYQRYFVWTVEQAIKLMDSLSRGIFTPPVIIASYREDENNINNIVLDGQQRLSSVLLCYLGYWPTKFIATDINLANEESQDDDGRDLNSQEAIEPNDIVDAPQIIQDWNFKKIQDMYVGCSNIHELKITLSKNSNYEKIEDVISKQKNSTKTMDLFKKLSFSENSFKESFLGFSFIKGLQTTSSEEKKFFSEVFRKINTSGTKLTHAESRAAFYWLNPERKELFTPTFVSKIRVGSQKFDWVRSLAFVAEAARIYNSRGGNFANNIRIAVGYGRNFEDYFERYAQSIVEDTGDNLFPAFNPNILGRLENLENTYRSEINKLDFPSLVDADYYLWGLMFWIIFQGRSLKDDISDLKQTLENEISKSKSDISTQKNPNRVGLIRERMKSSIAIYKDYVKEND